jgi:hypothetical protein
MCVLELKHFLSQTRRRIVCHCNKKIELFVTAVLPVSRFTLVPVLNFMNDQSLCAILCWLLKHLTHWCRYGTGLKP